MLPSEQNCIWYGICYTSDEGKTFNCPNTGTGQALDGDEEAQKMMLKWCPDIFKNSKSSLLP